MRASCGGMRSILPWLTLMRKVSTIPRLPRSMVPHVVFILGCSARCFEGRVGKHWPHERGLGFVAERRVGRHGRVWPHGRTRFRFRSPTERVVWPLRHHHQRMLINVLSRKVMMRSPRERHAAIIACSLPGLPYRVFSALSTALQPFPLPLEKGVGSFCLQRAKTAYRGTQKPLQAGVKKSGAPLLLANRGVRPLGGRKTFCVWGGHHRRRWENRRSCLDSEILYA